MSHRSCGPLIAVWIANVYLVKNIEKSANHQHGLGSQRAWWNFGKTFICKRRWNVIQKFFQVRWFACFKMRKLLLTKSQLLLPSGEAGGAWRTVLAGWRKRPGRSTLPPLLYNRWSTLFQACRCPKTRLFLDFFRFLYVVSPWWNIAFLSFLSDHHAQSETQAGKRTTGLTTVLQHGPGVFVTRRRMYNCFPLWCILGYRPTRVEIVLICF